VLDFLHTVGMIGEADASSRLLYGGHAANKACLERCRGLLSAAVSALQQDLAPVLALRRVVLDLPHALLLFVLPLVALHLLSVVLVVHCVGKRRASSAPA